MGSSTVCDANGSGSPVFEIRDTAGPATDLLMRGHGCTVVAESVRVAVCRSIYTELNARLLLQTLPLGAVTYLSGEETDATRVTNEGQVDRPWNLRRAQARAMTSRL